MKTTKHRFGMGNIPAYLLLLVLLQVVALFAKASSVSLKSPPFALEGWERDYEELSEEINETRRNGLSRKAYAGPAGSEHADILTEDASPLDVVIRRTEALLHSFEHSTSGPELDSLRHELSRLKESAQRTSLSKIGVDQQKELYYRACLLRRNAMLANPVIDFDSLIFLTKFSRYSIVLSMDWGWSLKPGGGIYVLSDLRSGSPKIRDILKDIPVKSGRYTGEYVSNINRNNTSAFSSMDLDYDGCRLVFSWAEEPIPEYGVGVKDGDKTWHHKPYADNPLSYQDSTACHLFTIDLDSDNLVQITDGSRDDYHPCWLPDGRIGFVSIRNGGDARCNGNRGATPCGTLHSVKADGSDLWRLSYHETSDIHPSVDNTGRIVYTRWDYIDRDYNIAHHLWHCGIDGTDPRSPHGNYPLPHDILPWEEESGDMKLFKKARPWSELWIRAIPGTFSKYVAIASGHHRARNGGHLVTIDISVPDDNKDAQVTKIDPGKSDFPGDGGANRNYLCPWPLNETTFLVGHGNRLELVDAFGNREVLYEMPIEDSLWVHYPIPLRPRTKPPVVPYKTWMGERGGQPDHYRAVMSVMNVYEADFEWPENTKITALRIVQIAPKPWEDTQNRMANVGYSRDQIPRLVLGTVPVESDGSAYFEAPVGREIYFQALDDEGYAVQSMRSGTYVHPGEHLSCIGCHEDKWSATPASQIPLAMKRQPSRISQDVHGSCPVNFHILVKPVFQEKCMPCHVKENAAPDFSYKSLEPYAFYFHASGGAAQESPRHGGSRSTAGRFGARYAPLTKYLEPSHYDVDLSPEEKHRIILWLDCNSLQYGSYLKAQRNTPDKVVYPALDFDSTNPTGVEHHRPLQGTAAAPFITQPIIHSSYQSIQKIVNLDSRRMRRDGGSPSVVRYSVYDTRGRTVSKSVVEQYDIRGKTLSAPAHGVYFEKTERTIVPK